MSVGWRQGGPLVDAQQAQRGEHPLGSAATGPDASESLSFGSTTPSNSPLVQGEGHSSDHCSLVHSFAQNQKKISMNTTTEHAVFAGGCFWCLDAAFRQLRGVSEVTSGYCGGQTPNPTYESVCSGQTGHAEAISVLFDPSVISYPDLLTVFFGFHDPTTLNRQGNDSGTQYRSAIFTTSQQQVDEAHTMIAKLIADETFARPIVTTVEPLTEFFPAERYHQDFYTKNPGQGYCSAIISPKLAKLRQHFGTLLRS